MEKYRERKRLLLFGLPWTFTVYEIDEDSLNIKEGFLNTKENDCYLYKIQDVSVQTSLIERIFGLSTVSCYTGDTTHSKIDLIHIKHGKEIKDYIMKTSDEARLKRRTINTLNINADADIDNVEE